MRLCEPRWARADRNKDLAEVAFVSQLVKVFSQAYVRSLPSSKAAKAAASVDSRAEPEVKEQSADKRDRRQSMSRFSARLREAAIRDKRAPQLDVPESSSVKRSSRRGTLSTLRSASSADLGGPTLAFLDGKPVPIPKYDGQRRGESAGISIAEHVC